MSYKHDIRSRIDVEADRIKAIINTMPEGESRRTALDSLANLSVLVSRLSYKLDTSIQLYVDSIKAFDQATASYEEERSSLLQRMQFLENRINCLQSEVQRLTKENRRLDEEAFDVKTDNTKLRHTLDSRTDRVQYLEELLKLLLEDYDGQSINIRETGSDKHMVDDECRSHS